MKKQYLFASILLLIFFSACQKKTTSYSTNKLTLYVNPFIGTGGHGHTYPGATLPFGMVQLSPDTRLTGWDGCSGYHYSDSLVYGFSHTHLSGTGVSDYGDVLLMPTTGPVIFNNGSDGKPGYASSFQKSKEVATPGYYYVFLEDPEVKVSLTATERCGFHQYEFPQNGENGNIILDLVHRDQVLNAGIRKVSETEIEGYRISSAWAEEQYIYFVMQFSAPIAEMQLDSFSKADFQTKLFEEKHIKAGLTFDLPEDRMLKVKVGISAVDIDGARKNLNQEIPSWDFLAIQLQADQKWNEQLSKIRIKADEKIKEIFYTAQYHNSLAPNLFQDVDGRFRGVDKQVHESKEHTHYTIFSLWDTYRASHPLFTITEKERSLNFIKTMLAQYDQRGELPVWELAGHETYCMIGYHSVSAITDAYLKGIQNFDAQKALEAMVATAEAENFGKPDYQKSGYLTSEIEPESVSKTLEYAYNDWCIAQFAKSLGRYDIYEEYTQRAQSYKNLLDPVSGFFRPKNRGRWIYPFDPREVNFHFTEANSWQYSFYVPQDVNGWIEMLGGPAELERLLDGIFTSPSVFTGREQSDITGLIGQYAHGNEPSHHIPYLYNFVGKPAKGQEYIQEILYNLYDNAPNGLPGNEDCGQMSAWYIMSALGFYQLTPGTDEYILGIPIVERAEILLENGNTFAISTEGRISEQCYVQSVTLNGKPYDKTYIKHEDIMKGGELHFTLSEQSNTNWGLKVENRPQSRIEEHLITPVPVVTSGKVAFFDQDTVTMTCPKAGTSIYYKLGDDLNGKANEAPLSKENGQLYDAAIILSNTTELLAIAYHPESGYSKPVQARFIKIPKNRSITLLSEYAPQYAAGGDDALINSLTGGSDYRTGDWQGYQEVDLEAIIDLGEGKDIQKIAIHFLQDENSWIFMPLEVTFETSMDGRNFKSLKRIESNIPPKEKGSIIEAFLFEGKTNAQYVKVIGKNRGFCPPYHKGAGRKSWIFADEIIIK